MDCPTITEYTGKHYKAHTDSGAAISLVRYSMYQNSDNNLKTAIQSTLIHLNTVDGTPMTASWITTLQLQTANYKFPHNFIICDKLPNTQILFGIKVQKKFALSYTWDLERNSYIQKEGRFLSYTRICKQKANVDTVKSTLNIPPRHNGVIPMKIKGHTIKGHIAFFISDQDLKKGKNRSMHISGGIHNIKGRTYVKVLVSNYTNKHIIFNKGEHVGHLELPIEDMQQISEDSGSLTAPSFTMKKMMAKKVEPDTFEPSSHKLRKDMIIGGTVEGKPISICTRWDDHWNDTNNQDDNRYRRFWTGVKETISNSDETLHMG